IGLSSFSLHDALPIYGPDEFGVARNRAVAVDPDAVLEIEPSRAPDRDPWLREALEQVSNERHDVGLSLGVEDVAIGNAARSRRCGLRHRLGFARSVAFRPLPSKLRITREIDGEEILVRAIVLTLEAGQLQIVARHRDLATANAALVSNRKRDRAL